MLNRHHDEASPVPTILHYTLSGLIPLGQILALNLPLGTLGILTGGTQGPVLLAEQQFTPSEVCLLRPLLETFPQYCPYEVLLASFTSTVVTEDAIERCRTHLQRVEETPEWDETMRPVRNVLSRVRLKLKEAIGIDIRSLLQLGYVLIPRRHAVRERSKKPTQSHG